MITNKENNSYKSQKYKDYFIKYNSEDNCFDIYEDNELFDYGFGSEKDAKEFIDDVTSLYIL